MINMKKAKPSLDRMNMIRLLLEKKKRKLPFGEKQAGQPILSKRDEFIINCFLVIADSLKSEIEKRAVVYMSFFDYFSFFRKLLEFSKENLRSQALNLLQHFGCDSEQSIVDEAMHLSAHLLEIETSMNTISGLAGFIFTNKVGAVYPNVTIALRIFLCTLASNCSAERPFSCLRRIKNYLRSTLCQESLNSLAILAIV